MQRAYAIIISGYSTYRPVRVLYTEPVHYLSLTLYGVYLLFRHHSDVGSISESN